MVGYTPGENRSHLQTVALEYNINSWIVNSEMILYNTIVKLKVL